MTWTSMNERDHVEHHLHRAKISPKFAHHLFDPPMIGLYYLSHEIGNGAYATVWLGIHSGTGHEVALKCIDKKQPRAPLARIETEAYALCQLNHHPNITSMVEFLETPTYFVMVMEYVPGFDLHQHIRRSCRNGLICQGLPIAQAFGFFHQLVSAVGFCHAHGIAHRDLKPENILMTKDCQTLKLADFGLAGLVKPNQLMHTACGSPHYVAPEIVLEKKYDGRACDVWSLGVILFVMLTGRLPFAHPSTSRVFKMICRAEYEIPRWFSTELRDLIQQMLCLDPNQRITIQQIKEHSWWLQSCTELGLNPNATAEPQNGNQLSDKPLTQTDAELCPPICAPYDAEVLNWMVQIQRWDVEDLITGFRSDKHNVAKTSYLVLLQQKKIDGSLFGLHQPIVSESDESLPSSTDPSSQHKAVVQCVERGFGAAEANGCAPPMNMAVLKLKNLILGLREKVCRQPTQP